jgi:hypothetical protein
MEESFRTKATRKTMKFLKVVAATLIGIAIALLLFFYFVPYEEGVMAGKVLRISKKGMIFKTYEGKINLETFGALKGTSPIAESFDFSIESNDTDVIKQLEEVSLSGERVNLHFKKRYVTFPWLGDTKYFATSVERIAK